jgi:serine/threonine protein kinase
LKVKVIDFDLAQQVISDKMSKVYAGTRLYLSPQILQRDPYSLEKNQVWQLGCLLFALYFNYLPFENNDGIIHGDLTYFLFDSEARGSIPFKDANAIFFMLCS